MVDRREIARPDERRVSISGIAWHAVAILSAASLGAAVLPFAQGHEWVRTLVVVLVAGAVVDARRWQPAHVKRSPWWATVVASLGALGIAAGCFAIARALGLPQATVASFRLLSVAVSGGLVWTLLNVLPSRSLARAVDRIEEEGAEVRARWTLPRPNRPLNAGRGAAKRLS